MQDLILRRLTLFMMNLSIQSMHFEEPFSIHTINITENLNIIEPWHLLFHLIRVFTDEESLFTKALLLWEPEYVCSSSSIYTHWRFFSGVKIRRCQIARHDVFLIGALTTIRDLALWRYEWHSTYFVKLYNPSLSSCNYAVLVMLESGGENNTSIFIVHSMKNVFPLALGNQGNIDYR